MTNRRDFLKTGAFLGAGALMLKGVGGSERAMAAAPAGSPKMTPFVDPLITAIPVLTPDSSTYAGADYYEIVMSAGSHKFHSQLLGSAATLRYEPMAYLGPVIQATKNRPVIVKFINRLPPSEALHPLAASIDPTVPDPKMYNMGLDGSGKPIPLPGGRAVPHLHGGFTAPQFDGHPHSWFTPNGERGTHYGSLSPAGTNEAILLWSNQQPAAPIWYHDHAMGITRLNVYAGLAGLYFVRDAFDTGVADANGVGTGAAKLPAGPYEIPLVIQDKQFNANGTLFYPTVGITAVHPIWVPEFFGDTPVVNAVAYPFLAVEPRRYRFRLYNGSQARFYDLSIDGGGNTPFYIIGMEQSLLPTPVLANRILLAPGERADIIVDFAAKAGKKLTLKNSAKAPYPGGRGGVITQIMQFQVSKPLVGTDMSALPTALVTEPVPRLNVTTATIRREIVMKEDIDPVTGLPIDMKLNGKWFDDQPIDETPRKDDIEVWEFINLTVDAHPMHMHLVKFQVYDRQPFNAKAYTTAWLAYKAGGPKPVLANFFAGPPVPPLPEEMGWKDTAKAYPGEILRVAAKFELPTAPAAYPEAAVSLPAEYVYHCHILEHEENEMMRPFAVTAGGTMASRQGASQQETVSREGVPTRFALHQNYPNPFNPATSIRFEVPQDVRVTLKVFNGAGQEVATLADQVYAAGIHTVHFNARQLASGVYYTKMTAGSFTAMGKMILVK